MAKGKGASLVKGKDGKEDDVGGGGKISEAVCVKTGGKDIKNGLVNSDDGGREDEGGLEGEVQTRKTTGRVLVLGEQREERAHWRDGNLGKAVRTQGEWDGRDESKRHKWW